MIFCLVMSQYLNSIFLNPLSYVLEEQRYELRYQLCILNLTETELSFQTVRKLKQI